jgi:glycine/D-amino acid oxidase-like deaminating enzyme
MDVLVVGGGIVGAAVAAGCASRGMSVTLVERGAIAGDASRLELALLGRPVAAELEAPAAKSVDAYQALHRFTGGAFLYDASPTEASLRRIDARAAAAALLEEARGYRAAVYTGRDVKRLLRQWGKVVGAQTDAGELRAPTTVVAAGARSWEVCRELAFHVPVRGSQAEVIVAAPPGAEVETAAAGEAWVATDGGGRLWIARPAEAAPLLPEGLELDELDRRTIAAPSTPDGLPLHGPIPDLDGLVLACGHGDHGIALAPGAGAAVAAGIESGSWDPTLSPARFASPPGA